MTHPHILIGAGCLSIFSISAGYVFAQQGNNPPEGGPLLTFGISSTVSATDNYSLRPTNGDGDIRFDTDLSFSYLDRRANDRLSFVLDGVGTDSNRARVSYDREGVNSALSLGADYNLTALDALNPFDSTAFFEDDLLDENDLTQDQGDRQQVAARFSFETGINDPVGLSLDGRYRDQTYRDTIDPGLFDTETFSLTGTTRLTISPVTEARLVLRYEDYTAENPSQTHRQTSSVNLGLTQALSSIDNLNVSLGIKNIETAETILGVRSSDAERGVVGSLGFTRELLGGTIGTTLDLNQSINGRTATWLVNRELLLPRGEIDVSIGVTRDVNGSIHPVGEVDFLHEMLRSTLSASLSRQVATSTRANELLTTRASLGYKYEINSLSDLDFAVNYAAIDQAGGPAVNSTNRTDLSAAYSRALTRDWQFTSGYEYRMREETGAGTATSNRVFITLQREFTLRP